MENSFGPRRIRPCFIGGQSAYGNGPICLWTCNATSGRKAYQRWKVGNRFLFFIFSYSYIPSNALSAILPPPRFWLSARNHSKRYFYLHCFLFIQYHQYYRFLYLGDKLSYLDCSQIFNFGWWSKERIKNVVGKEARAAGETRGLFRMFVLYMLTKIRQLHHFGRQQWIIGLLFDLSLLCAYNAWQIINDMEYSPFIQDDLRGFKWG